MISLLCRAGRALRVSFRWQLAGVWVRAICLILLASPLARAGDLPKVDGLLPDSGASGIPTVEMPPAQKGGAVAAMLAVPPKYADGILEVTGLSAAPDPARWVIQAWNTEDPGTVHKLTVEGDQFLSDNLSINIYEAERKEINVPVTSVRVDSRGVWEIAGRYAAANGAVLGSMDLVLTCHAKRTPPVWSVTCLDPKGGQIGRLEILSTTGEVQSSRGFKNAP